MAMNPMRRRGFYDAQDEVNRMFEQFFGQTPERQMAQQREWVPAIDAFTRDNDLVIRAEMPGMRREDVDITLSRGVLTISGQRSEESEREEASRYLLREHRYGSFRRSMTLPEGTDSSKVHARFREGVLEVTVENAAVEREPERIQIEEDPGEETGS